MGKLQELAREKYSLESKIFELKTELECVMDSIGDLVSAQLVAVRTSQAKEFGAVNITVDGYKITETVPKKVSWDSAVLAELFKGMLDVGDNPELYMKVKLDVPEKMYEGFAPAVKEEFNKARVVDKGSATLKIEEVKGA